MSGRLVFLGALSVVAACSGSDDGISPSPAGTGGASGSVASAAGSGGSTAGASGGGTSGSGGRTSGASGVGGSSGMGGRAGAGAGGTTAGAGAGGMAGGAGSSAGAGGASAGSGGSGGPMITGNFSFFVTSLVAIRREADHMEGFGGDLGGLEGADAICQRIAAFEGAGHKTWRAFLSATTGGPNGGAVNAIDRIGDGPWYDRRARLVAMNKAGLMQERPDGDDAIVGNLPDEKGEPLNKNDTDDHDMLTGSNMQGQLMGGRGATCNDWTSREGATGRPMCGHGWPARSGMHWIQSHPAGGCGRGINLVQSGMAGMTTVGGLGGYGGFYCFALQP